MTTDPERDSLTDELAFERQRLVVYDYAIKALEPLMADHPERTLEDALAMLDPDVAERVRAALPDFIKARR